MQCPSHITVSYKVYLKLSIAHTSSKHMTKSIARGHKKGLVDQCFSDVVTYNSLNSVCHEAKTSPICMHICALIHL